MPEREVQDEPQVLEGDDDLPRQPPTTQDAYRPHFRDRQPWAARWKILLWAWIPVALIVAAIVWGHYR